MGIGIYKPGQGYWVRVLSAAFAGVLLLAGSAWLWNQLESAASWIPTRAWTISTSQPAEFAVPGSQVTLIGPAASTGETGASIGTATVRTTLERGVELESLNLNAGADASQINAIASPAGGSSIPVRGNPIAIRAFEPLYIQAAGVSLLLLIGAILIFWLVASKASTSEFLIATDGEMKKVNWSTRRDVIASTWVVILWSVLIATGLFFVDTAFATFFRFIGVLQS
jgi:preprotein translocase SecE subunit